MVAICEGTAALVVTPHCTTVNPACSMSLQRGEKGKCRTAKTRSSASAKLPFNLILSEFQMYCCHVLLAQCHVIYSACVCVYYVMLCWMWAIWYEHSLHKKNASEPVTLQTVFFRILQNVLRPNTGKKIWKTNCFLTLGKICLMTVTRLQTFYSLHSTEFSWLILWRLALCLVKAPTHQTGNKEQAVTKIGCRITLGRRCQAKK